jgi:hypothetical protein
MGRARASAERLGALPDLPFIYLGALTGARGRVAISAEIWVPLAAAQRRSMPVIRARSGVAYGA